MAQATGFVVAGGRSERMGRDKALLPWAGSTLVEHALLRLREVCTDVRILSGPEARYAGYGATVHTDVVRDAGPLAGLHAGLLSLAAPLGLFLGVPLIFLTGWTLSASTPGCRSWGAGPSRSPPCTGRVVSGRYAGVSRPESAR